MNADGSESMRLTGNEVWDGLPDWSPDGSQIVFVSTIADVGDEIYIMDHDGSNMLRLTENAVLDTAPAWSPNGEKIAFVSYQDPASTDLRNNFLVSRRNGPAPDADEIYVMDPDGSHQIRLTNNLASDSAPAWSPDGQKIVFLSNRDGDDEIYVMNADGSNQVRLTNSNVFQEWRPSWSPDGAYIAFDATGGIFVMNADGSDLIQLTMGYLNTSSPDWSPDGTKLVYAVDDEGKSQIYRMNADGSGQTNLTNNEFHNFSPAWGPYP